MFFRLFFTSVLASSLISILGLPISVRSQTAPVPAGSDELIQQEEGINPEIDDESASPTSVTAAKTSTNTTVKTLELLGLSFEAPKTFSDVRALPRKTAGIVYPEGDFQEPQMVVRFAEIPSGGPGWSDFSPAEQMTFIRYKILGSNNLPPREFSRRQFFGKTLTGEVQTIRTRTGYRYIELYIVPLEKSQRNIAIAFESDTMLSLATVETTIDTVTQSLKELEKPSKKNSKKEKDALGLR